MSKQDGLPSTFTGYVERERDCMPTTIIVIEILAVFLAMQLNQRYLPFVDVGEFKT